MKKKIIEQNNAPIINRDRENKIRDISYIALAEFWVYCLNAKTLNDVENSSHGYFIINKKESDAIKIVLDLLLDCGADYEKVLDF